MKLLDADVVVIGGGLSGLTTAFQLAQRGHTVEVLEARLHAGGVIGSHREEVDGGGSALYEKGPNSAMDTTPLVNQLLHELGIHAERIDAEPAAAKRYVLRAGQLQAVPTTPLGFFGTPLFSWRAKLALLAEPFVAPARGDADESVADFVVRRLGQEFLDYAIEPFVGGVYAGNPAELSLAAAFPRLVTLERQYGSLIKGQILGARERARQAQRTGEQAKNVATSFSFKDGMQTLTDALARRIPRVICAARVLAVRRDEDGCFVVSVERRGEHFERRARAVVMAVPAYEASRMVLPLAVDVANALDRIAYPPLATVSALYRRRDVAHPLDGFGFLAPRVENPPVLGTLFTSAMFSHRAPGDHVMLTSFVGGRRNPELAQAAADLIEANVLRANATYLGAGTPRWARVQVWPRAIPQYALGHLARLALVERLEQQQPGLRFCANWRGGVSVSDCIKSGFGEAERLDAWLRQNTPTQAPAPAEVATA